jgi:hypothetical protein
MRAYITISSYVLGRLYSPKLASNILTEMVTQPLASTTPLPGCTTIRTIWQILQGRGGEADLHADGGGSHIAKTRSRHFSAAVTAGADVWITVDDDVEADEKCLGAMLLLLDVKEPRIVGAPCLMRDTGTANFEEPAITRPTQDFPVRHREIAAIGTGLLGVNRAALDRLTATEPSLLDHGGELYPVFAEVRDGRHWYGEDISFCRRAQSAGIPILACLTGTTRHDVGPDLHLEEL